MGTYLLKIFDFRVNVERFVHGCGPSKISTRKHSIVMVSITYGTFQGCKQSTVESRSTDTRLIRTPGYCGQFRFSRRGKAHTFSLRLTHLIRTPVNTDTKGFHCTRFPPMEKCLCYNKNLSPVCIQIPSYMSMFMQWLNILPVHLLALVVCTERFVPLGCPKHFLIPFSLHSTWKRIPQVLCSGERFSPGRQLLSVTMAHSDHPNKHDSNI